MSGTMLEDGFSSTIGFSLDTNVKMQEKTLKPPGVSAGGENDVSTMRNSAWRTKAPKKLKTLTESSFKCAYDPAFYVEIVAMVGKNQTVTITFPDGATLVFYGWIDEFTPADLVEGQQPEAEVKIICSNRNGSNAETAPAYTAGPAATTTTTVGS